VRVPGIAYWKGTIKPGRVSVGLFDLIELYATLPADGASRRRAIYY
jgi:arylsulfatase